MLTATEQDAKTETDCRLFTFETDLGWFGIIFSSDGVDALSFGHNSENQVLEKLNAEALVNCPPTDVEKNTQNLLVAYAAGEPVDLSQISVSPRQSTPFQSRVIRALCKVGYGETISYAGLASAAGSPRAARAVGSTMARNHVPLIIPCHRVVGSGGRLGGFSAPQGTTMKQRLLDLEQGRRTALSVSKVWS